MHTDSPLTSAEVAEVLSYIPPRPAYELWVRVISAVAAELPDHEAEAVLLQWSPEDSPGEYRQKIRHRMSRISIGTLINIAKDYGFDSKAFARRRGGGIAPQVRRDRPAPPPPQPPKPLPGTMPKEQAEIYVEGCKHLVTSPDTCQRIDRWRGYPSGTTALLAEAEIISSPMLRGHRCIAFPVITPDGVQISFHARHRPRAEGEKPAWSYEPSGVPSLPFVIGGGAHPEIQKRLSRIVLTEGQWDTIALAAAAGLIDHDGTQWPPDTLFLGARGVSGIKPIFDYWVPHIPRSAKWVIFRDNDTHGEAWAKLADKLGTLGYHVSLRTTKEKDLNDALRGKRVNLEEVIG